MTSIMRLLLRQTLLYIDIIHIINDTRSFFNYNDVFIISVATMVQ